MLLNVLEDKGQTRHKGLSSPNVKSAQVEKLRWPNWEQHRRAQARAHAHARMRITASRAALPSPVGFWTEGVGKQIKQAPPTNVPQSPLTSYLLLFSCSGKHIQVYTICMNTEDCTLHIFLKKKEKNNTQFHELLSQSSNQAFQKWISFKSQKRLQDCLTHSRVKILYFTCAITFSFSFPKKVCYAVPITSVWSLVGWVCF